MKFKFVFPYECYEPITTWNVRSVLGPGELRTVNIALRLTGINITAIQETSWSGKYFMTFRDYTFYYSGKSNDLAREYGTGFMVFGRVISTLISFNPAVNKNL